MAEATIQLTCTIQAGPVFRVAAEITNPTDINAAFFVYKSGAAEALDEYVRVATLNDMQDVGLVRGDSGSLYRKTTVAIDSSDILTGNSVKSVLVARASQLVTETTESSAGFLGVFQHELPLQGD